MQKEGKKDLFSYTMAEGGESGDVEWELSKENIQPLRRGRVMSALQLALQEGTSPIIQQQKQAFESELRVYEGEDPLDVWDRYIKWTEQTFPQGGKESNLATLLERAVTRFTNEEKYNSDARYVDIWIKLAEHTSEPLDIYRYMKAQGIGVTQASLYIAWSEEYEKLGDNRKADMVFQEGFKNFAEPQEKLMAFRKALQARVSRQVMMKMLEGDNDEETKEPERTCLVDLKHKGKKKAIVPINRIGAVLTNKQGLTIMSQEPSTSSNGNKKKGNFMVLDENKAPSAEPSGPKLEAWVAPPVVRGKENEQKPEKWCDVKMPPRSRYGHHAVAPPPSLTPSFQPYVEDSDQPPTMTPRHINPSVNMVLAVRKPGREEETPLKRLQGRQQEEVEAGKAQERSMYCKELLHSGGTEFCFEEMRAERYRQKTAHHVHEGGSKDQTSTGAGV